MFKAVAGKDRMSQSQIQCRVEALDHLVLTVRSIEATVQFYGQVLGMRDSQFQAADGTIRWALYFGQQKINLHLAGHEFDPKSQHPTTGSADVCFLTTQPIETWLAHLSALEIEIEQGPVPRSGATGPLLSIYLRDPDANLIEISVPSV